ncbi:hypothetical protein ANO11243_096010 [Dothideomycetidae sp. 11243]|nr:hypothetical protein ANO11243_096010 [fungal sp. No.11243]
MAQIDQAAPVQSLYDRIKDAEYGVQKYLSSADLQALCLVSKTCRASAEPLLYSRLEWTWDHEHTPPIILFVRTILQRPQLATYVQSFKLLGDHLSKTPCWTDPVPTITTTALDITNDVQPLIRAMKVPFAADWIENLSLGTVDAWLALLLSRFYRLEELVIRRSSTRRTKFIGHIFSLAMSRNTHHGISFFDRLRSVEYRNSGFKNVDGNFTPHVLPFFYLPSLQHLLVNIGRPSPTRWPKSAPVMDNLTSLHLRYARESQLREVLSLTPTLKSLCWFWYHNSESKYIHDPPLIDLDHIVTILSIVRESLESLTIYAECESDFVERPYLEMLGSMRGLRSFKLKNLELPLCFLGTFEPDNGVRFEHVVPKTIESLVVTLGLYPHTVLHPSYFDQNKWDGYSLLPAIYSWMDSWREFHPRLRFLDVPVMELHWEWDTAMGEELAKAGSKHGVTVVSDIERDCLEYSCL